MTELRPTAIQLRTMNYEPNGVIPTEAIPAEREGKLAAAREARKAKKKAS